MARFFHYKSPDDLARDAERLGVDLRLTDDLAPLARPIDVGGRRVGNRLAIQPMEGCDAEPDGSPGALTFRRYERFGAGGAKLLWGEAAAVVPEGRANPRQLLADAAHGDALSRLVAACRAAHRAAWGTDDDLLLGLQLTHSGRYSHARPVLAQHDPLLDPLTIVDRSTGATAGPDFPLITDEDLSRLQDNYVSAAEVAHRAGFDFVDIKQCHRYLLNELLAAKGRPGRFGGPFENRSRFILELVGRLRDRVPGLLIATRLNLYDGVPYRRGPDGAGVPLPYVPPVRSSWGTAEDDPLRPDLDEPIRLVRLLRDAGVAIVNASLGNPYASMHLLRPFEFAPIDGYETPEHPLLGVDRHLRLTAALQAAEPALPVVGSGYSWLQDYLFQVGAASVRDGRAAFVGVGRGSLSHPDFARNVLEGRPLDRRRTCRTFSYCTNLMRSKHNALGQFPTGCPPFDREVYDPIWKEAQATAPTPRPS